MISLHLVADNSDPKQIDRAIDYLVNTRQTMCNVAGGSQVDIAMKIVERIHARAPSMKIMWRILEDTGNIFAMDANQWWAERVFPRLAWMKTHNVIMVVDNESSGDDAKIMQYADQSLIRMHMLHSAGLYGAFCRFATGNIQEHQYIYLKPLLEALDARDWISPNEYTNLPGKSSSGHLERYKRILAVVPNKHFNVAIGECGILDDYQAYEGYVGRISGKDMAAQLIADEIWYSGGSIPRFLFCIGGYGRWAKLQVGDDALEFLEVYYAKNPIEAPLPPPPIITPPPPPEPPQTPTSHVWTPAQIVQLEHWRDILASRIADDTAHLALVQKMLQIAKGT
jgi:hypothetical protein